MSLDDAIVCENLVKIYTVGGLEVQALQGLDLTVKRGELLGVVGASGSGKSTLLNVLGGLDRPTAGRVWVNGQNLAKMNTPALDRYRRNTVGFVWQQGARNLVPYLTAFENVRLPLTLAGRTGRAASSRAGLLLDAVGLGARGPHRLEQLSGGEQQRVAIAIALANQPQVLLADEPTGELDSATAQAIYEAFRRLNRELGLTTLIVSHDAAIARHVDRVVAVRDGKLATETVRRRAAEGETEHHELFQEWVLIDAAGRVPLPKEYLQRYHIRRRAQLELTEHGILIRPAEGDEHPAAAPTPAVAAEASPPQRGPRGWWQRLRTPREKDS